MPETSPKAAPKQPAADLPILVDDKVRHTPSTPAAETSVELGTGVTQVNYL